MGGNHFEPKWRNFAMKDPIVADEFPLPKRGFPLIWSNLGVVNGSILSCAWKAYCPAKQRFLAGDLKDTVCIGSILGLLNTYMSQQTSQGIHERYSGIFLRENHSVSISQQPSTIAPWKNGEFRWWCRTLVKTWFLFRSSIQSGFSFGISYNVRPPR